MRVVVAEDAVLLREGLCHILSDHGMTVTAQVSDAEQLLVAVAAEQPDLVITDVRMPPTHTDEGTRAALTIREHWPDVGIVVLSQHVEARTAVRLLREHPQSIGYLLKERITDIPSFIVSLQTVARGGYVVDSEVVSTLLRKPSALSTRELDVLAALAEGLSNQGIADRMFVTVRTVESHVASIFQKLDIHDSPDGNRRVLAALEHLRSGTS